MPMWIKFLISICKGFQLMLWVASLLCFVVFGIETGPPDW